MTKRMLIDATHAEETRVVVLDGNRLEDFDFETAAKRQLKGNIYLAKVVRVEPSLQAAFVDYGGNRHGFLAFSEIHPDYYQIPVADRQRLLEMQAEEAQREQEEEDRKAEAETAQAEAAAEPDQAESAQELSDNGSGHTDRGPPDATGESVEERDASEQPGEGPSDERIPAESPHDGPLQPRELAPPSTLDTATAETRAVSISAEVLVEQSMPAPELAPAESVDESGGTVELLQESQPPIEEAEHQPERAQPPGFDMDPEFSDEEHVDEPPPEIIGGDNDAEEPRERRIPPRFLRQYKIQEVIHRRQILLVQVVKEERGTKGAALTTYISLAGRYCVLMPNSPRGGGISRKITSLADRRRLKEVIAELDLPQGMGLIVRTAGANRPKPEIKRDCEYLLRLWDDIREQTLRSIAPTLIYEEANLIKRAIRDVYSRDIDEILVDGEEGWKAARDFMRMLMPSHVRKVQLWRDPNGQPLFARYQVDAQLDAIVSPIVQLRSGGYLVINQAEALVAIDVNSGRSTRERGIEETALRTNLEAADEVARQLRLRDLAGLIVIDFIDMELRKHNGMVERRLKEDLKADRARIQVGHISHFGLLEMSRQRLRPSLTETSFVLCPHCGGTGHIRTVESAAISVLRAIEEEGGKRRAAEIVVHTSPAIALYIFNHKRQRLSDIEQRYTMRVIILTQDGVISPPYRIERLRAQPPSELSSVITPDSVQAASDVEEEEETEPVGQAEQAEAGLEDTEQRRRRRRRRRHGGRREEQGAEPAEVGAEAGSEMTERVEGVPEGVEGVPELADSMRREQNEQSVGRRRRRRRREERLPTMAAPGAEQPDLPPLYAGPTPADPFGGQVFDIFDAMEEAAAQPVRVGEPFRVTETREEAVVVEEPPQPAEPLSDVQPESVGPVAEPGPEASAESVVEQPQPVVEQPPAPANDQEPAIKPIIVGAEEGPVEKKRGWWRR